MTQVQIVITLKRFLSGLKAWAPLAAFIAAGSAVFTVWNTTRLSYIVAERQAEATAVTVLQDYVKLSIANPDLANRSDLLPVDPRYEWFAAHAFITAEAIFRLMGGNIVWDGTVSGIVQYHQRFVADGKFSCPSFDRAFAEFVENRLSPGFKCMRP